MVLWWGWSINENQRGYGLKRKGKGNGETGQEKKDSHKSAFSTCNITLSPEDDYCPRWTYF